MNQWKEPRKILSTNHAIDFLFQEIIRGKRVELIDFNDGWNLVKVDGEMYRIIYERSVRP